MSSNHGICCDECGTGLWINNRQILADGVTESVKFYCRKCNTYKTIRHNLIDGDNEVEVTSAGKVSVGPKILVLDIETAPINALVWQVWKTNVYTPGVLGDWYIMSWAAKWLHGDETFGDAQNLHVEEYAKNPEGDKAIMETLWPILHEADIVITHNGDRFDIPKIQSRFLLNKMPPPSPYKSIDTLKVAKKEFAFTWNKLDYITNILGVRCKLDNGGMETWIKCREGCPIAWERMFKYNIRDIVSLEDVYLEFLPWIRNHPNQSVYMNEEIPTCPRCKSVNVELDDGFAYTNLSKFERYVCTDCKSWSRGRKTQLSKNKRKNLLTNITG